MQDSPVNDIEGVSLGVQLKFLEGYEQVALNRKDVTLIKFFQSELYRIREKLRQHKQ